MRMDEAQAKRFGAALEELREQAMRSADKEALERLLAPDLSYVHSNGSVQSRGEYIGDLTISRKVSYRQLKLFDVAVCAWSDSLLVVGGIMDATIDKNPAPLSFKSIYTALWQRTGDAWMLTRFQGTKVPA